MPFHSIILQYLVESLTATAAVALAIVPRLERRDPRKVLIVVAALNVLRLGGVAGALSALAGAPEPSFLAQVAIGDGAAAVAAVVELVALLRRWPRAGVVIGVGNALGLGAILVSESWLAALDASGRITIAGLHGPTIGAAVFTALHALALYLVGIGAARRVSA